MSVSIDELKKYIRSVSDWPVEGIIFRDITPLLANADALASACDALCRNFEDTQIDYVGAVEARGFIFGAAIAERLGAGFIPIRKAGKLPCETLQVTYELEYGTDTLELHREDIKEGASVLMVDDLLATGGSMRGSCDLIEKAGGRIAGISFLIELTDLKGRDKLDGYNLHTIIKY